MLGEGGWAAGSFVHQGKRAGLAMEALLGSDLAEVDEMSGGRPGMLRACWGGGRAGRDGSVCGEGRDGPVLHGQLGGLGIWELKGKASSHSLAAGGRGL